MRKRSTLLLVLAIFLVAAPAVSVHAQQEPSEQFLRAEVIEVTDGPLQTMPDGTPHLLQEARMRIIGGEEEGREVTIENGVINNRNDMRLHAGETIVVRKMVKADGSIVYTASEKYRFPALVWLFVFFLVLAVLFGGWKGLGSIVGLVLSIGVLTLFIVPRIAAGENPLLISLVGACFIACTSLYLAHGFTRRTTVALGSTLITLGVATIFSIVFVTVGKLFGMGSEESMFLQTGTLGTMNLRGLLLGGIIIGCLGVLDDITTAQTAAVDEIRKANPSLSPAKLLQAGLSVGREHIASLINTLALAYAGASLPLLLLFQVNADYPLWFTFNSEFLAEEVVRTLVGSSTLLLAVPISTWFAVRFLGKPGHDHAPRKGHVHIHWH